MKKLIEKFTHWQTTLPGLRDLLGSILVFINAAQYVEVSDITVTIVDVLLGAGVLTLQGVIGIKNILAEDKDASVETKK